MRDLYLCGPDESAITAALDAAGWRGTAGDGGPTDNPPPGAMVDRVGAILRPTGETETVTEGEGEATVSYERPVYAAVPGYHVNIRLRSGDLPAALQTYEVFPETPHRVWL